MVALIRMNAGEGMYSKKFFLISQSLQKKITNTIVYRFRKETQTEINTEETL